jgi:hypothetical protein
MGLAMALSGQSQISADPFSDVKMAFVIEELIPEAGTKFVKYIGNDSAHLRVKVGELGYDTAVFLAFCQHVQWLKTGVFISDYQGVGKLLTDPQVMTP